MDNAHIATGDIGSSYIRHVTLGPLLQGGPFSDPFEPICEYFKLPKL